MALKQQPSCIFVLVIALCFHVCAALLGVQSVGIFSERGALHLSEVQLWSWSTTVTTIKSSSERGLCSFVPDGSPSQPMLSGLAAEKREIRSRCRSHAYPSMPMDALRDGSIGHPALDGDPCTHLAAPGGAFYIALNRPRTITNLTVLGAPVSSLSGCAPVKGGTAANAHNAHALVIFYGPRGEVAGCSRLDSGSCNTSAANRIDDAALSVPTGSGSEGSTGIDSKKRHTRARKCYEFRLVSMPRDGDQDRSCAGVGKFVGAAASVMRNRDASERGTEDGEQRQQQQQKQQPEPAEFGEQPVERGPADGEGQEDDRYGGANERDTGDGGGRGHSRLG